MQVFLILQQKKGYFNIIISSFSIRIGCHKFWEIMFSLGTHNAADIPDKTNFICFDALLIVTNVYQLSWISSKNNNIDLWSSKELSISLNQSHLPLMMIVNWKNSLEGGFLYIIVTKVYYVINNAQTFFRLKLKIWTRSAFWSTFLITKVTWWTRFAFHVWFICANLKNTQSF